MFCRIFSSVHCICSTGQYCEIFVLVSLQFGTPYLHVCHHLTVFCCKCFTISFHSFIVSVHCIVFCKRLVLWDCYLTPYLHVCHHLTVFCCNCFTISFHSFIVSVHCIVVCRRLVLWDCYLIFHLLAACCCKCFAISFHLFSALRDMFPSTAAVWNSLPVFCFPIIIQSLVVLALSHLLNPSLFLFERPVLRDISFVLLQF